MEVAGQYLTKPGLHILQSYNTGSQGHIKIYWVCSLCLQSLHPCYVTCPHREKRCVLKVFMAQLWQARPFIPLGEKCLDWVALSCFLKGILQHITTYYNIQYTLHHSCFASLNKLSSVDISYKIHFYKKRETFLSSFHENFIFFIWKQQYFMSLNCVRG